MDWFLYDSDHRHERVHVFYLEASWQLISCKRPVSLRILQVIKSAQEIFVKDLLNLKIAKELFKEDWYFIITKEN